MSRMRNRQLSLREVPRPWQGAEPESTRRRDPLAEGKMPRARKTSGGRPQAAEDRVLSAARRRANARIGFYSHAVSYASVLVMLLVTTRSPRVVLIVAACWGVGLAVHYFVAIVAPALREQILAREMERQVQRGVDRERRELESRKTRSLEDLSASIAHEIRNPITAAKSLVQQMGEDPVAPENIDYARVALDELDRVERSISHLLRFARDTEMRPVPISLADLVDATLESFADRLQGVRVQREIDVTGEIAGDPEKLRRVLANLISNALEAMQEPHVREPRLEVALGENLAGSEVWLRVADSGPGIDRETQGQIFDPFYTTKASGTGLGLALSRRVVEAHGGHIEVRSREEGGCEFVLTFPRREEGEEGR